MSVARRGVGLWCSAASMHCTLLRQACALMVVLVLGGSSGCTSRELYAYGQEHQREQCRVGLPSEYDDCMARANESHDTYQRKIGGAKPEESL